MTRIAALLAVLLAAMVPALADELSVQAPPVDAVFDTTSEGVCIRAPGYMGSLSPGDPDLPFVELNVVLPPDADPGSVTAEPAFAEVTMLPDSFDIAPAPPFVTVVDGVEVVDWGIGKQISGGRNMLVYGRDALYPAANAEVTEVGSMRQWKIARVRYYPYRWNPTTGQLELTDAAAIRVSFSAAPGMMAATSAADTLFSDKVRSLTVNFDEARMWYGMGRVQSDAQPQAGSGYLIVTTSSIVSSSAKLQSFITHKQNRGFNVIVATEQQWGGGTGNAAADAIRNYLKNNYSSLGIHYVLLIGGPDPASGTVPMKMLWPRHNQTTYQEAPSDYYYADLTGNWDRDGDGYFGEEDNDFGYGGIDRLPEVIVGRIPFYGSHTDLDSILQKTINYESGVNSGSWTRRVLLSMEPSDTDTPGYHLGEAIKNNVVVPSGFTYARVYNDVYGLNPQAEYIPCNPSNVLAAWQQRAGMHVWWTHGSSTSASDVFSSSQCQYLDNGYPSFTFQCSCNNGYPETSSNLGYSLLKRGAISTVSASRVSWYYPGQTTFASSDSNAGIAYTYSVELVKNRRACGDAHYATLSGLSRGIWMNHCVFNLYADPSVAHAVGPQISHTPLRDSDNTTAPYEVAATVTTASGLSAGGVRLMWKSAGAVYTEVEMQPTTGSDYVGYIAPQPMGSTISYYIVAVDDSGWSGHSPVNAPASVHTFTISTDATDPTIGHVPLQDTGNKNGPYTVTALVTDDRALGSVTLFYRFNDGPEQSLAMLSSTGGYTGSIPGPATPGDSISYYIVAVDASANANTARHPLGGYHTFGVTRRTTVVVLNSASNPPYFVGGNGNPYSSVASTLTGDPAARFEVTVVTSLTPADVAPADVIVLPDNGVAAADVQAVDDWFGPGKRIVAIDSAVCYAAYSGYMWPASAGSHGYGVYWDYASGSNNQKIWKSDPITTAYVVDDIIASRSSQTQYYTAMLPPDAVALSGKSTDAARCYAAYRDVPGKGRIVILGPFSPPLTQQAALFRDAVAPTPPRVDLREAKAMRNGSGVLLSSVVVTCDLEGYRYVQDSGRTTGLRINAASCPPPMTVVDIYGNMTTIDGERALDVLSVTQVGVQPALQPLSISARCIGGSGMGLQQPVWEYRYTVESGEPVIDLLPMPGMNNVGLLVRAFGRVTDVGEGFFYLDDGSCCDDGSGNYGVRVICLTAAPPDEGSYIQIDAISSTHTREGVLYKALVLPPWCEPRVLVPAAQ